MGSARATPSASHSTFREWTQDTVEWKAYPIRLAQTLMGRTRVSGATQGAASCETTPGTTTMGAGTCATTVPTRWRGATVQTKAPRPIMSTGKDAAPTPVEGEGLLGGHKSPPARARHSSVRWSGWSPSSCSALCYRAQGGCSCPNWRYHGLVEANRTLHKVVDDILLVRLYALARGLATGRCTSTVCMVCTSSTQVTTTHVVLLHTCTDDTKLPEPRTNTGLRRLLRPCHQQRNTEHNKSRSALRLVSLTPRSRSASHISTSQAHRQGSTSSGGTASHAPSLRAAHLGQSREPASLLTRIAGR